MASRVTTEDRGDEQTTVKKRISKASVGVSFQPKLSVFSFSGTENEFDMAGLEEDDIDRTAKQRRWWISLAENQYFKQLFRTVSAINLVILALSIPYFSLVSVNNSEKEALVVSIQFKVIAGLDFLLACAYTFHLVLRVSYYCYTRKVEELGPESPEEEEKQPPEYTNYLRLCNAFVLTITMWYSVAIGVYRSIQPVIFWVWYLGFVPRAILAVFPVINLSLIKMESSAVQKLFRVFKWKQLAMVTMFYFIFIFIFALMGVHIIGGLDYACVYKTQLEDGNYSMVPALPLKHCSPSEDRLAFCGRDGENITGLVCAKFPHRKDKVELFFDYRSSVYYGQFRMILDSLYAVYEASTLELWSFMMYTAFEGRGLVLPLIFYFFLVFFIVVILQQSLFLVVIIESFADLRDKSFFWKSKSSSKKTRTKPNTVLSLQDSATNKLQLQPVEDDGSVAFIDKYSNFLVNFEKVFLVLVIIDAVVTATKHAEMDTVIQKIFLQVCQMTVSILFVIEIVFLFFFHFYHGQWKLFLRRPYYICLVVLAVGGLVAALPIEGFYDPLLPGNGLVIFQALRFPRLLRLSQTLLDFTLKIVGKSIPILSVITIIVICWLAVFNAQIFGYVTDYPEECSNVGGKQFSTFADAFLSTFQLVMNEAWTDITSEVMCRSKVWFLTNFYFIFIHLFSSLIFLNFFGAVILDNLEYDEEEKKAKLEQIKKKEAELGEAVPPHLKIFEKLGNKPKKLKPPPGAGGEVTNLDEVEVRKFFDSANTSNLVDDPFSYNQEFTDSSSFDHHTKPSEATRQVSQFQLSLVSSGDHDLIPSEAQELQRKFASISTILNYIKIWRKYNEEMKCINPRSSNIHYLFGQSPYNKRTSKLSSNNEYEVYKEKHRFFDMSLFCMPPEHKLRKLCTTLLTAQMEAPRYVLIEGKGEVLQLFKKRLSFLLRWILSRLPYSKWIMFWMLWIIITVELYDFSIDVFHLSHVYTLIAETIYLLLMFTWLTLRVISRGCFLNPHAAINSMWDVVDWILVLHSAVLLVLLPVWFRGDYNWLYIEINIPFLPYWVWYLFIIRSLRPLHILSLLSSLKAGVREIVEGWKNLLKAVIIMFGFMLMFASLGVQLFAGTKENPLAFCNDPSVKVMGECVGEFRIRIDASREFLPLNDSTFPVTEMLVPRVWFPNARDFPFNNVGVAFVTLFELLTLEGWTEVRDMFSDRNDKAGAYMQIYIHTFVFFAVNIGLQLFLGVVINNFNEHKPGHTFLLSVEQNRWADLMQRVSLQRPDKLPQEPRGRNNKFRLLLYRCLTHHKFRFVPTVIIALSALTLVVPWDEDVVTSRGVWALILLSIILNLYTIIEMVLKLLAFGPAYFQSWRNMFDFALSFLTFAYTVFAMTVLFTPFPGLYRNVSYFALSLAVTKLLTVMVKYSVLLNLLLTVFSTLFASVPLVLLILIVSLCYTLLGVTFFGNVRSGEAIDYRLVNFRSSATALSAVWRSITGEDWYQIMWDAAVRPPYCQDSLEDCGNPFISFFYFGTLTFILSFILLNVFIAVLLENFSIFYSDEVTNLDLAAMKDFKKKWRKFDLHARGHIPISRVKLLLRSLDLQSYYTYDPGEPGQIRERVIHELLEDPLLLWEMEEELEREALSSLNKAPSTDEHAHYSPQEHSQDHSSINVEFLNVLRMLAYRCEDIHRRLESHELFQRRELEQTVQLDVAENCILKWLKKRVKPFIENLKKEYSLLEDQDQPLYPVSIKGRRQQLFSLHNAQSKFLDVQGWGKQSSMDTEDEDQDSWRHSWSLKFQTNSEEQMDYINSKEGTDASQSLNRLKQKYTTPNTYENAKEWFKMQDRWMENIKTNPDYFDDGL